MDCERPEKWGHGSNSPSVARPNPGYPRGPSPKGDSRTPPSVKAFDTHLSILVTFLRDHPFAVLFLDVSDLVYIVKSDTRYS